MRLSASNFGPKKFRLFKQDVLPPYGLFTLLDEEGKEFHLRLTVEEMRTLIPVLHDAVVELTNPCVFKE